MLRERQQVRIVGLAEEHHPGVVGEVGGLQLGVAVDSEAADDEPLEVPGEEVREPERARLGVGHGRERVAAGEHLVAMGARQPLDAFAGDDRVDQAARAAIGIRDEDPLEPVGAGLVDAPPNRVRDPFGAVVEVRCETGDLQPGHPIRDGQQLAGEGAAADDEGAPGRSAVGLGARAPGLRAGDISRADPRRVCGWIRASRRGSRTLVTHGSGGTRGAGPGLRCPSARSHHSG